jgi:hypothetical protein
VPQSNERVYKLLLAYRIALPHNQILVGGRLTRLSMETRKISFD